METLDLTGAWRLEQKGQTRSLPATVPGCVHTDLLDAGRIPDPYVRDNERALHWIGETDWTYTRRFEVARDFLQAARILLQCEGLDTLAPVELNGRLVGRADNMYRTWEWNVKPHLRPGVNTIAVRFASPMAYIRKRQSERPIPGWFSAGKENRAWLRKEPCNFGWDWGPTLVTCGIWRPLRLVAFHTARLASVRVQQDLSRRDQAGLTVEIQAETLRRQRCTAAVTVTRKGRVVADTQVGFRAGRTCAHLTVLNPELWWPNGLGEQPLYEVTVDLLDATEGLVDTQSKRIGLRTLRLERKPDRWGESFRFVANGVPFFAKGANWIPADTFASRLTTEHYALLLESAAAANMNMLRVWGGGIYEDDAFYDLCDELGLCIWQDFMFACSTYPTFDRAFLANVRVEAEQNVARLRHHPCIALWCGNNELEQGLVTEKRTPRTMSWKDYSRLFDELLPAVVHTLDPGRDYWPGSPHSPRGDRRDYNNPRCGDAHLWDVWHGRKPFEWYRTCEHRFNSEFGFQAFPEPRTVCGYTAPEDRNVTSFVMEHHQRSGIGNTVILQYMLDWFRLPHAFDTTLWLTQILQGMAIKYAAEHWRRSMPRGMGTLYWQLNDCWPVASWSSIDSLGRWKALHYMARHFFAPLLISGLEDMNRGTVEIHVTSDRRETVKGTASWTVTDLAGRPLARGRQALAIPGGKNTRVQQLDLTRLVPGYDRRTVLVWLELAVGRETVSRNLVLMARPKHLELADPGITTAVQPLAGGNYRVTMKAKRPALWTWLELSDIDATFSDNFVHLRPGVPVAVDVVPAAPLSAKRLRAALRVTSLRGTYA